MPRRIYSWTPDDDQRLRQLRATLTWQQVGAAMGIPADAAYERGRSLPGVRRGWSVPRPVCDKPADKPTDRAPLPAGSAASWDILNRGLSLAGAPYRHHVIPSVLTRCAWPGDQPCRNKIPLDLQQRRIPYCPACAARAYVMPQGH